MPKPVTRAYFRYSQDALVLLSQMIKRARIDRQMTMQAVAERAGISRGLLRRIEAGDPRCAIGVAFEVAAIVGVPLFDARPAMLSTLIATNKTILTLLPNSVRASRKPVFDDF
jgi:transcriptional regulator with XRE-family HTH domain